MNQENRVNSVFLILEFRQITCNLKSQWTAIDFFSPLYSKIPGSSDQAFLDMPDRSVVYMQ